MALESKIERAFVRYVRSRGGLCIKQNPAWYVNIPDRLVVCPGGWCFFLEFKRPGEKPRLGQERRIRSINRKRIPAYWADSLKEAIEIYEAFSQ